MTKLVKFLSIAIFLLLSLHLIANNTEQYSNLRFKAFSTQKGLSQSSVLSIAQDAQGFIWMGTKDGLNRFDGYNFETFKSDGSNTSLSNNEIIYLLPDSTGNLFIGTRGGGLNKYIKDENRFIHYPILGANEGSVSFVSIRKDGSLWIGSSQGLIQALPYESTPHNYAFSNVSKKSVFLNASGRLLPFDRQNYSVVTLENITDEDILVGADKGLFHFNLKDFTFTQVDIAPLNEAKVNDMEWDRRGWLWVATSEGLMKLKFEGNQVSETYFFDNSNTAWNRLKANWIEKLTCDFDGNMWIGTRGTGVIRIDEEGSIIEYNNNNSLSNGLGDNIINSLLIDESGVLWIGTESRGAVTLDLFRKKFNHLENSTVTGRNLTSNLVTAITGNDNVVWVGSAYNGLNYLEFNDDQSVKTRHIPQIPYGNERSSSEIISLLLDQSNKLWIGTASNNLITYHENEGFKTIPSGSFPFSLYQDKEEDIWIGTWGKGLGLLSKDHKDITFFANQSNDSRTLSGNVILSIFEDREGNLWVGTKGHGLNVIPLNLIKQGYNNFITYQNNNEKGSILHNDIYCILQDSEGLIWIGTGGGLNQIDLYSSQDTLAEFNKGRAKFKAFTEDDGLPANLIYGILEDKKGNIWVSTTKGLSVFDKATSTFKNFTSSDGLQSNEFHSNAFYASDENFFFGGVNGLTFFNPGDITTNKATVNVVFSGLKVSNTKVLPHQKVNGKVILNKDISTTETIELSANHKEFSIEFTSLNFSNSEGVKYAYRLLGFNDEWRNLGSNEHSVTYTNLWEGDYTFQVKATNNDGVWNSVPRELSIQVHPPFWRHPWFYLIYLIIIVIGLLLFRRYTLIGVSEKNRLLIEHIERTNLIENTEAKMRFFTNISHEIRTPLTLINNPLEEVIKQGKIDDKSRSSLQLVLKNVNRLMNLTNQLLQLRKIDKGGIEPQYSEIQVVRFLKEVTSFFLQKALNKEITLSFTSEIDEEETFWIDSELITTAIYNVISNAYKFTPSKGQITITVFKQSPETKKIERWKKRQPKVDKEYICIEVSDSGPGMDIEEMQNIFLRFYQSKHKDKSELAGSGIGLSIVKEYVELCHGRIEPKSKLGEGSTFTIYLPTGKKHVKESQISNETAAPTNALNRLDQSQDHSAEIEEIGEQQKDRPTILLVEDDKELCNYVATNLADQYNIVTANDGKKGCDKAIELLPNLIISDIMMPERDGYELCDFIKSNSATKHIPIILLTAKAADESKIEGYQRGADLYVSKPFKMDVLKSQIEQVLANRKLLVDIFSKQITLEPRNIAISSADEKFLTKLNEVIDEHLSEADFDVTSMVEKMNLSHSTVLKKVKSLTKMSLVEFVKTHRLKRAAQILEQQRFQIAEVAYMVGFNDPKYFSKCFSKEFGKTPTEFVQEARKDQPGIDE